MSSIDPVVSEEKMFENVDGRTDGRRTEDGVTGILIAHLGAFGSGELKIKQLFFDRAQMCDLQPIGKMYDYLPSV